MAASSIHTGFRDESRTNSRLTVRYNGLRIMNFTASGAAVENGTFTAGGGLTVSSGGASVTGDVTVTGDINPEADGTRDLGTQTTAQWANVWSDNVNGADFSMANGWRMLESELYGYDKGFAIGHSSKWDVGKAIWSSDEKDQKKYMDGETPVFAVTDDFLEFKGRRMSPEQFDRLLDIVEPAAKAA